MIIKINKLERGTHTTTKGVTQAGLYVYGTKVDQEGKLGEDWDKFLAEQFNADQIAAFEKVGVGNVANVRMQKNGKFWNVADVTPLNRDYSNLIHSYHNTGPVVSGGPTGVSGKSYSGSKAGNYREPEEIIRTTALNGAITFLKSCMDFQAAGEGKVKIFPLTKINLDILTDKIEELAVRFTTFIKGKKEVTESDAGDLVPVPEMEEPISIPDDDIPF